MIDYRLAPEHPFPAAVDDAVQSYRWLLAEGCEPNRLAIVGASAGGGLTFATLLALKQQGVPLPARASCCSTMQPASPSAPGRRVWMLNDMSEPD